MDGRDIGTVVLPNAQIKIFLTASPEARATRRYKELCEKGMDVKYEDILQDVITHALSQSLTVKQRRLNRLTTVFL